MTKKRINVLFYEENICWLMIIASSVKEANSWCTHYYLEGEYHSSVLEHWKWWLDASNTHEHIMEASSTYLTVVRDRRSFDI